MYIKLGSIKANYPQTSPDDFMIFSEVVNSQMSYESPRLVRSISDLDKWFGKDFEQRSYYEELITRYNGLSLYLYKPTKGKDSYRVLDDIYYYINDNLYSKDGNGEITILAPTVKNALYKVCNPMGDNIEGDIRYSLYVCWLEDWDISEEEKISNRMFLLPDYLPTESALDNRDTLQINRMGSECLYSCPRFKSNEDYPFENSKETILGDKDISFKGLDYKKIFKGYQTYSFNLSYKDRLLDKEEYFLDTNTGTLFCNSSSLGRLKESTFNSFVKRVIKVEKISDIINKLEGCFIKNNILYSTFPCQASYFYEIEGLVIEPNLEETMNLLGARGDKYSEPRISFWSKTIGTAGEEGRIKVKIECPDLNYRNYVEETEELINNKDWNTLKNEISRDLLEELKSGKDVKDKVIQKRFEFINPTYRITLKRYDYEEIFEATLYPSPGLDRLDYYIEKNSELAYCTLIGDGPLQEGEWEMIGSIEESYNQSDYENSMKVILENEGIHPDYFMIPSLNNYTKTTDDLTVWWSRVLNIIKEANCQLVVQNSEEDYKLNYTKDKENRIIYFLGDMLVGEEKRPGYYLYLRGLLENIYSYSSNEILYNSPDQNDYYGEPIKKYEDKKCNYLTNNGHTYYYRTYFNGPSPESTGWMRFAIGKISRELEKNKWLYLGEKSSYTIQRSISQCLQRIENNFGIIKSISIEDFSLVPIENKLQLTLETSVSDIVNTDTMIMDLTINFNN